jgi:5-methylphenazine-1-carboxylate 1-monooxygenase
MKVVIVGGGIGGLSLALSLHAAGLDDLEVFEANAEVRELGLGINMLPHAVRELTELDLGDGLAAVAIPTAELVMFSTQGQEIWREPRGIAAGYRWPQYSIHRGHLLQLLHRAFLDRIGEQRLHTAYRATAYQARAGKSPTVRFANGDVDGGDVVIGADGVHSVVRGQMFPNEGAALWNGITMWRGAAEADPVLGGRSMALIGHFRKRIIMYPISAEADRRGRSLINMVLEIKMADDRPMPKQDWNHEADRAEIHASFDSMQFDWIDLPRLIDTADPWYQYPMVDRDPLPTWTEGRVILLGDAAHPMYPVGSNGGSQAILDARTLARELALQPDVDSALAAYESIRRPATSAVVLSNRQVGAELPMEIVAQRAPDGFENIADVVSREELEEMSSRYKQLAGFDPNILNNQPSLSVIREPDTSP